MIVVLSAYICRSGTRCLERQTRHLSSYTPRARKPEFIPFKHCLRMGEFVPIEHYSITSYRVLASVSS